MTYIFRFAVTYDDGMAPNSQDGMLSLLSCKPDVRLQARVGDWAIGYRSKRLGGLCFAGKIARKLTIGDYQAEFSDRRDAVYRSVGFSLTGNEQLEQLRPDYHAKHDLWKKDIRGRYVLLFDPYWYWGCAGHTPPEFVADMAHPYVGHARKASAAQVHALEEWLGTEPAGHLGEPCDPSVVKRRLCGGC